MATIAVGHAPRSRNPRTKAAAFFFPCCRFPPRPPIPFFTMSPDLCRHFPGGGSLNCYLFFCPNLNTSSSLAQPGPFFPFLRMENDELTPSLFLAIIDNSRTLFWGVFTFNDPLHSLLRSHVLGFRTVKFRVVSTFLSRVTIDIQATFFNSFFFASLGRSYPSFLYCFPSDGYTHPRPLTLNPFPMKALLPFLTLPPS